MAETSGNQSISLGILLQDLKANVGLLKRRKFLEAFPGSATARHNFDKVAGSVEASEIPASVIDDDLARLRQICKPAADFTDKVLAHTDRDQVKVANTSYEQLDKAIDCLLEFFQKYYLLLTAREHEPPEEDNAVSECLKRLWN
jgi:hypothetical protein